MNIRIANDNDIDNNLLKLYIEAFNMHYENRKDIFINKATNSIWIDEIIIDNDYKKKGYGKKLIMEVAKFAEKNNCKRIELNCWSFNRDALKFYEKIGFIQQRIIFEKEV